MLCRSVRQLAVHPRQRHFSSPARKRPGRVMLRSTGKDSMYVDEDMYTERHRRRLWAMVADTVALFTTSSFQLRVHRSFINRGHPCRHALPLDLPPTTSPKAAMATTREVSSDEPYSTEGDDEYDVYLFWPSLRRTECAFSTNEHSIYGVCSLFYPYVAWGWPSRFSQRVVCQPVAPSFDYDDYFDGLSYLPPVRARLAACQN